MTRAEQGFQLKGRQLFAQTDLLKSQSFQLAFACQKRFGLRKNLVAQGELFGQALVHSLQFCAPVGFCVRSSGSRFSHWVNSFFE